MQKCSQGGEIIWIISSIGANYSSSVPSISKQSPCCQQNVMQRVPSHSVIQQSRSCWHKGFLLGLVCPLVLTLNDRWIKTRICIRQLPISDGCNNLMKNTETWCYPWWCLDWPSGALAWISSITCSCLALPVHLLPLKCFLCSLSAGC